MRDDHVHQLFTQIDVGGFQRAVSQRAEVTGTRGSQQGNPGRLRGRPDVIPFGFQAFVVGEVCQYDLAQHLGLFVRIVTDNGTVIVDLVAHQIARLIAVLARRHDVVRTGVLLHGVGETHVKRGWRRARNGARCDLDIIATRQHTTLVKGQRGCQFRCISRYAAVLRIHFPGVSWRLVFDIKQVHVVRITLTVKHRHGAFLVVRVRVGRIEGDGWRGIGGVQVDLLRGRGGGLRRHQRRWDGDRLRIRTGLHRRRRAGNRITG